jgi:thymidylate synthase (FAD)
VHVVEPKVFIIAETLLDGQGLSAMLAEIGAEDWSLKAPTSGEGLIEVAGRLCYKSFGTELNANITKTREGNDKYLENILHVKHGSVLEHATTSVAFINCSRIFTHELVRHRPNAFSQESMRFVRLDDIPMWIPDLTEDFRALAAVNDEVKSRAHPSGWQSDADWWQEMFEDRMSDVAKTAENYIREFTALLDKPGVPFGLKKKITSALRRMAPSGHATNIIKTGNHRQWRLEIEQRTAPGAELEIGIVFDKLAKMFKMRYPNIYQDMEPAAALAQGQGWTTWVFASSKV